jgi:hypothetical protein
MPHGAPHHDRDGHLAHPAPPGLRRSANRAVTPAVQDRLLRALPALVLAALLGAALLGWWLFPALQRTVAFQDCAASGRTDCTPHQAPGT